MTEYEIREVALALIGGGWKAEDKDFFIEENAKQDEENIIMADDIDRIFSIIEKEEGKMMERIDLCTILLNDSDTERQTISWDPGDHKLYSSVTEEPIDTPDLPTVEAAEDFCYYSWFKTIGWDPQWIERDK